MAQYPHNRGANLSAACQWVDSLGTPINLYGMTFAAFEITPSILQSAVTITVTDQVNGRFTIGCPWSSGWPPSRGAVVSVGVQASNGQAFYFDVVLI